MRAVRSPLAVTICWPLRENAAEKTKLPRFRSAVCVPVAVSQILAVPSELAVTALFFGSWIVLETLLYGKDVPGYPSLVVSVMVIGGVQLILIGVLGEYIGKLLSEIKGRPVYFVADHSVKRASEADKARPMTSRAAE